MLWCYAEHYTASRWSLALTRRTYGDLHSVWYGEMMETIVLRMVCRLYYEMVYYSYILYLDVVLQYRMAPAYLASTCIYMEVCTLLNYTGGRYWSTLRCRGYL